MSSMMDERAVVLVDDTVREGRGGVDWSSTPWSSVQVRDLSLVGRLDRHVSETTELVVVDGDDRLVHRALTAGRQLSPALRRGLRWAPLRGGEFDRIARDLGAPRPSAAERAVEAWLDRRSPPVVERPAIRVEASSIDHSLVGLTVGGGACYTFLEARHRGGGLGDLGRTLGEFARGLTSSGRNGPGEDSLRFSVDYRPRAEALGYLLASGLRTSWFGIELGDADGARMLAGEQTGELVSRLARDRALPSLTRGSGERFDRIHLDWSGDFAVDGELYSPASPYALEIAQDHSVPFADLG